MGDQRVDQRAVSLAGGGMDDQAGRLVDDEQVLVLEEDVERQCPRRAASFGRRRRLDLDLRAVGRVARGIAYRDAVDLDMTRLDQRLEPGARQREAALAGRLAEEAVEPLADVARRCRKGEALGRHRQRRRRARLRRACGRRFPRRSRPRTRRAVWLSSSRGRRASAAGARPAGSRRRRGDQRAERGDDLGQLRARAGVVAIDRPAHGRDMRGGRTAAAADDARAGVDRQAARSRPSAPACRNNGYAAPCHCGMPALALAMTAASGRACVIARIDDEQVRGADPAIGAERERRRIERLDQRRKCGRGEAHHRLARGVEARGRGIGHGDARRPRAPRRGFPRAPTWSRSR